VEESSEDEDIQRILDQNAVLKNMDQKLSNINKFLKAENKLINDWEKKDLEDEKNV